MAENASNANPTQTTAVSEALKEEYKKQWPRGLDPESEKWPMWMVVLDEEARIFGMTTDALVVETMLRLGYEISPDGEPWIYESYTEFKGQKRQYSASYANENPSEKEKDTFWVVQPSFGQEMEFDKTGRNPASTVQYGCEC